MIRNQIHPNKLHEYLESQYMIKIRSITKGERGFVAETFVVTTDSDTKYFCKVAEKKSNTDNIPSSLPVLLHLEKLGIDQINYPIRDKDNNLHSIYLNHYCVLFNFIDATWTYDVKKEKANNLLAQIHLLTPEIKTHLNTETFTFKRAKSYLGLIDQITNSTRKNSVETKLKTLIKSKKDQINTLWKTFQSLSTQCKKLDYVPTITHGDAFGNVMVDNSERIYLVDWDDILLAPPERDTWFSLDRYSLESFTNTYTKYFPQHQPNHIFRDYYLLLRYFEDLEGFLHEILTRAEDEVKQANYQELIALFKWLDPVIDEFIT